MAPKRYDPNQIKHLAIGRWPELLGLSEEILSGRHQPCPKCGGNDRFRALDDFRSSGAVICNKCFNSNNGDGIATFAWLHGKSNGEAICELAVKLGVEAEASNSNTPGAKSSTRGKASKSSDKAKPKPAPSEQFKWMAWNDSLAALFCLRKPGIVSSSLVEIGAKIGNHFGGTVIALPVRDFTSGVIGYLAANASGGKLIIERKDGQGNSEVVDRVSWKNVCPKGNAGIVATPNLFDEQLRKSITRIYKMEGPSDLLAIIPFLRPNEAAWTNPAGAGENPGKFSWILEWCGSVQFVVIHDADQPGQKGATGDEEKDRTGFAGWALKSCKDVRNVELPFPLVENHGKDFRDWVVEGGDLAKLDGLVESAARIGSLKEIRNYIPTVEVDAEGVQHKIKTPVPIKSIIKQIVTELDGWPKCVDGTLFYHKGDSIRYFPTTADFFGWLRERRTVRWGQGEELATKDEFFSALKQNVDQVSELQSYPHFPLINGMYYTCEKSPKLGDGKALEGFLDFFNPDHPLDRQLMMACVATVFWGGPPGQRPGWLITSPLRQGAGKSSFSEKIAGLVGGLFDFNPKTDPDKDKTRLLSKEGLNKRIARYDNIKAVRFSLSTLESLITSEAISGHRMYQGEGSRANYLTWFITMNDPELSRDLAQRCVSVSLGAPRRDGDWTAAINQYIKDRGQEIIEDVAAFYQRPIRRTIKVNRWGAWVVEVLCRLDNPQEVFDLIEEREKENDSDAVAAECLNEYVHRKMNQLKYFHPSVVHLPNQLLARWANNAIGNEQRQAAMLKQVKQMADSGLLQEIEMNPSRTNGRGWLFRSMGCADGQVDYEIEKKISEYEKRFEEKPKEKDDKKNDKENESSDDLDF
jgi:hypothetical protein